MAEIDNLLKLIRERPARAAVTDQRYWDWDARMERALRAYDDAHGATPEGDWERE